MNCPFSTGTGNNISCKVYGEVSKEKANQECLCRYETCYREAQRSIEARSELHSSEQRVERRMAITFSKRFGEERSH